MSNISSSPSYAPVQKWLHWIIAFFIAGLVPVGLIMAERAEANLFDELTNTLYSSHKLAGIVVLLLMVWRLLAKRRYGALEPVPTLTPVERIASASVHHLLYLLLFLTPLVGWAAVSAYPALDIFGLFNLPPILPANEALAKRLFGVHKLLAWGVIVLVAAHVGAAALHGVIKQDGVVNRMIGWWPLRK